MTFLDLIVEFWHQTNIKNYQTKVIYSEDNSKLVIEIDTQKHLAIIEAWENAYCLNIHYISLNPIQKYWPYAGECKSFEEAKNRIIIFYDQLNLN